MAFESKTVCFAPSQVGNLFTKPMPDVHVIIGCFHRGIKLGASKFLEALNNSGHQRFWSNLWMSSGIVGLPIVVVGLSSYRPDELSSRSVPKLL
jgi:hypothetical protein